MYDENTRILSPGSVAPEAIRAFFIARGKALAPQYAPDGRYQEPPAGIERDIVELATAYGVTVNHDLLAAQIIKESAAWQSEYARSRCNPSGLGAVNHDPDQAIRFATPRAGIRATVAHLLAYAVGDGAWAKDDPRFEPVKRAGWLGAAPTLKGLDGKWAYPGIGYGKSIAAIANDLRAFADHGSWNMPLQPPAGWRAPTIRTAWIPKGNRNRPGVKIRPRKKIVHDTGNPSVGANAEMHRKYVHGGGGDEDTSYQFVVDDREVVWLLPLDEKGHHALSPCNDESVGVELCINADGDWERTLWNGAWLCNWIDEKLGPLPTEQHFDCTGKDCPARIRKAGGWGDFLAMIDHFKTRELAVTRPASVTDPEAVYVKETDCWLQYGFRGFYQSLDPILRLRLLGHPRENERKVHLSGGVTVSVQRFERAVLKWTPNTPAPWDIHCAPLSEYGLLGVTT